MKTTKMLRVLMFGLVLAGIHGVLSQTADARSKAKRRAIAAECMSQTGDAVIDFANNCEAYGGSNYCDQNACLGDLGVSKAINDCASCMQSGLGWEFYHAVIECEETAASWCEAVIPLALDAAVGAAPDAEVVTTTDSGSLTGTFTLSGSTRLAQ